jgi:1-deoxy-D-xylulose-5-phosphate reductoisomerase
MATFTDGATIAQLSLPDMRLPIAYALAYPDRVATPFGRMDFSEPFSLDFEPPDVAAFGCLSLAYRAGREGGTAPAWLSAANEAVVEGFLAGRVRWVDISALLACAMDRWPGGSGSTLEEVLAADEGGRKVAAELLAEGTPT